MASFKDSELREGRPRHAGVARGLSRASATCRLAPPVAILPTGPPSTAHGASQRHPFTARIQEEGDRTTSTFSQQASGCRTSESTSSPPSAVFWLPSVHGKGLRQPLRVGVGVGVSIASWAAWLGLGGLAVMRKESTGL